MIRARLLLWPLLLSLFLAATTHAVTVSNTDLGLDEVGNKINSSTRTVVVPLIVLFAGVTLAATIIFALRDVAGKAIRTIVGLAVLAVTVGGAGLAAFFPNLITSVTILPPLP